MRIEGIDGDEERSIVCCNCDSTVPKDEATYYSDHGEWSCDGCQFSSAAGVLGQQKALEVFRGSPTFRRCIGKNCPCLSGDNCPPIDERAGAQ